MGTGRVFLVGESVGDLQPMAETPYSTEDVLQQLLASYPDLLPGDQITPEDPRRWLFVARELGVPGEEGGSDIWSLDHLFLDQDGVPTFVECKRATDTRNRREVVAQMLDYAANGTAYWPMDRIRQTTAESARATGATLDEQVQELLDSDGADVEAFWQTVEDNLRNGRVRLLFVADRTPRELRRLVEFMNDKMADVEVLAIEIKQYLGDDRRIVVPRVIGLTEAARSAKSSGQRAIVDRDTMLAGCEPAAAELFAFMLDDASRRGHVTRWGTSGFSVGARSESLDRRIPYVFGYPPDRFEFYFEYLQRHVKLTGEGAARLRQAWLEMADLREAGKYTLKADVTDANLSAIKACYSAMADQVDSLTST